MADTNEALPLADRELQSLRNMGCEFEAAANEISELRAQLAESKRDNWGAQGIHHRIECQRMELRRLQQEMQQQALRSLTSEGEWIEMTGKLRAEVEAAQKLAADRLEQMQADRAQALVWRDEVERRGDVIRGHEATLTRLQGDLLRAGLKLEASRLECEGLRVDAERYQWLRSGTRVRGSAELEGGARIIDKSKLYALMSFNFWCKPEELDAAIDTARSAASGESAEGGT